MTILCLALGNPIPTISLYIGGHFVRSEIGRHMVTIIQNVTKDMEKVACQVSNGYGVPMQATTKIRISCECDTHISNARETVLIVDHFQLRPESNRRASR